MADAWLVAGLGNPGDRYAGTRHNAGAMVVERLCERLQVRLRKVRFLAITAGEAKAGDVPVLLTVPATFMNVSGPPIASFARKRSVPAERVIACHDEIDLPFGALRVKRGGGTAGHHGLDSLVEALRTDDFFRVRLGVGRPPGRQDPVGFVLQPFAKREREDVEVLVEDAADAVLSLVTDGLAITQSRYNRAGAREE
ncbi:aminoacyl-tRNA hydrolase [soil metagenome]